jgi:hypothetical protein
MLGGFAAPIVAGAVASRHGLAVPLWIAAAGAIVVFLVALLLRPTGPRRPWSIGTPIGLRPQPTSYVNGPI